MLAISLQAEIDKVLIDEDYVILTIVIYFPNICLMIIITFIKLSGRAPQQTADPQQAVTRGPTQGELRQLAQQQAALDEIIALQNSINNPV